MWCSRIKTDVTDVFTRPLNQNLVIDQEFIVIFHLRVFSDCFMKTNLDRESPPITPETLTGSRVTPFSPSLATGHLATLASEQNRMLKSYLLKSLQRVYLQVFGVFIFSRIKKGEGPGKGNVTVKTMMNTKANERLNKTLIMCLLDRTRRKKYEERS